MQGGCVKSKGRAILSKVVVGAVVALLMLVVGFGIITTSGRLHGETPEQQADRMEGLPIDSNAYDLTPFEWDSGAKRRTYKTYTTGQDVNALYDEHMKSKGWTFSFENNQSNTDIFKGYEWIDPSGSLPYDLRSFVSIYDTRLAWAGNKGPAYVSLTIDRIPKLGKVPLYPDARQVETRYARISTAYEDTPPHTTPKTITYLTSATVEQVKSYYIDVLSQHGWGKPGGEALEPVTEKPIPGSLVFRWLSGSPHVNRMAASVGVIVDQEGEGTKVELRIRGETYFGR
jgi:hypothetical protein